MQAPTTIQQAQAQLDALSGWARLRRVLELRKLGFTIYHDQWNDPYVVYISRK